MSQIANFLSEESFHALCGFRKKLSVCAITGSLDCILKIVRSGCTPFGETARCLGAVIGSIDFDTGQLAGRVAKFVSLPQTFRIKSSAPRLICPATDPASDSRVNHACAQILYRQNSQRQRNRSDQYHHQPDPHYACETQLWNQQRKCWHKYRAPSGFHRHLLHGQ